MLTSHPAGKKSKGKIKHKDILCISSISASHPASVDGNVDPIVTKPKNFSKRSADVQHGLRYLKEQYNVLREQLYAKRMRKLQDDMNKMYTSSTSKLAQAERDLREELDQRLVAAANLRAHRLNAINDNYEAEKLAAIQTFKNEKKIAMDEIYQSIVNKIKKLEKEHAMDKIGAMDGTDDVAESDAVQSPERNDDLTERKQQKSPQIVDGPYAVYQLREEDIAEDIKNIRKGLAEVEIEAEYMEAEAVAVYQLREEDIADDIKNIRKGLAEAEIEKKLVEAEAVAEEKFAAARKESQKLKRTNSALP